MYVGFSTSTGAVGSDHYILGWSFNRNGQLQSLDFSKLPLLPRQRKTKKLPRQMIIVFLVITIMLITITAAAYIIRRKKYEEILEDWEIEYGTLRFF